MDHDMSQPTIGLNGGPQEEPILSVTVSCTTAGRLLTDLVRHDGRPLDHKVVAQMLLDATALLITNALTSEPVPDASVQDIRLAWVSKWLNLMRQIIDGARTVDVVAESLEALRLLLDSDPSVKQKEASLIVSRTSGLDTRQN